jgi:ABC-type multidrug transport system fused ATPase/permease subunit
VSGRLWTLARRYVRTHLLGLLLLLLTNGLALSIPWLLRGSIHALERGAELRTVGWYAAGMIAVALGQAVARTGSRLTILGTSRRIASDIREVFFRQLERLDADYYDTHRTGDIMSRGVNDIQLIQSFFGPGVLNLLNTAIVYSATLVLLLRIDPLLTLVSLMLFPVLFVGVNRLSRRVYSRSRAVQEQLATISNRAQENISGMQQVKTFVQESPVWVASWCCSSVGASSSRAGSASATSWRSTPIWRCSPGRRSRWAGLSTRFSGAPRRWSAWTRCCRSTRGFPRRSTSRSQRSTTGPQWSTGRSRSAA